MRTPLLLTTSVLLSCTPHADPDVSAPAPVSPTTQIRTAPDLTEADGEPYWELQLRLAQGALLRQGAHGLEIDGDLIAHDPAGPVSLDSLSRRLVIAERVDGGPETRLLACEPPAPCVEITDQGSPDRAAISPGGELVAWVSSASGLPSVYVAPFKGGPATQLTNVGLSLTPGVPPRGFVEPPHDGPLTFHDGELRWDSPEGPQQVQLP